MSSIQGGSSWTDIAKQYQKNINEAPNDALRKHYEAELKQIQPTLDAMDIDINNLDGAKKGSKGTQASASSPGCEGRGVSHGGGGYDSGYDSGYESDEDSYGIPAQAKPNKAAASSGAGVGGSSGVSSGGVNQSGNVGPNGFSTSAQQGALSAGDAHQMSEQVARQLMKDFGMTKEQAAGIIGNLSHESAGMNSNMNQTFLFEGRGGPGEPTGDMNQGFGWAQWSYDRKEKFLNFSKENGLEAGSPEANYAFMKHELETTESGSLAAIKNTRTPDEAAAVFRRTYERAEIANDPGRLTATADFYNSFNP